MYFWEEALYRPGAVQLLHLKNLMLSRPYLDRIPDQGILVSDPGRDGEHIRATRSADGSYEMVYLPRVDQHVEIDLRSLVGPVQAWWYDPRNGQAIEIGIFARRNVQRFTSPPCGPDWVLVLDHMDAKFGIPGRIG